MNALLAVALLFAVAEAQFPLYGVPGLGLPGYGFPGLGFPGFGLPGFGGGVLDESYAASLAGAPVGLYGKKNYGGGFPGYGGFPGFGYGRPSEVTGASLGGAKVGLYGKSHDQQRQAPPQAYPVPLPVPVAAPLYGKPGYGGYGKPVRKQG